HLSRNQRPWHDGGRGDPRSRIDSACRAQDLDARPRAHRRGCLMRALRYSFDEGSASLWRGRQSALVSTAIISLALLVLGGFLIAVVNLQQLTAEWGRTAGMSVYLDDAATGVERAAIERALAPGDLVAGYQFVSKADALKRFKATFVDLSPAVDTLDPNPL